MTTPSRYARTPDRVMRHTCSVPEAPRHTQDKGDASPPFGVQVPEPRRRTHRHTRPGGSVLGADTTAHHDGTPPVTSEDRVTVPISPVRLRTFAVLAAGVAVGALVAVALRGPSPAATEIGGVPGPPAASPTASPTPTAASVGPLELAAAHAYLDAVRPIADHAGFVVQQGMKPALTELHDPDGDHERIAAGAPGYLGAMTQARKDWAALTPPVALRDAHALFLEAFDRYVEAAERLVEAANDDDRRLELIAEVADLGTRADGIYNRAAALVQAHLVAGGADPVTWLPDRR